MKKAICIIVICFSVLAPLAALDPLVLLSLASPLLEYQGEERESYDLSQYVITPYRIAEKLPLSKEISKSSLALSDLLSGKFMPTSYALVECGMLAIGYQDIFIISSEGSVDISRKMTEKGILIDIEYNDVSVLYNWGGSADTDYIDLSGSLHLYVNYLVPSLVEISVDGSDIFICGVLFEDNTVLTLEADLDREFLVKYFEMTGQDKDILEKELLNEFVLDGTIDEISSFLPYPLEGDLEEGLVNMQLDDILELLVFHYYTHGSLFSAIELTLSLDGERMENVDLNALIPRIISIANFFEGL